MGEAASGEAHLIWLTMPREVQMQPALSSCTPGFHSRLACSCRVEQHIALL